MRTTGRRGPRDRKSQLQVDARAQQDGKGRDEPDGRKFWQRRSQRVKDTLPSISALKKARRSKHKRFNFKRQFRNWGLPNQRTILIKFITSFIAMPVILTSIGAIVEQIIYGKTNAPGYHVERMLYSGVISAPFVFLRWIWPKSHISKLEFAIYAMSFVGFVAALSASSISGETLYYAAEHIRGIFNGDNYDLIATPTDVFSWLEVALKRAFKDQKMNVTDTKNKYFRLLPGRIALFGPVRLKQSRAREKRCAQLLYDLNLPGLDTDATQCYSPYDIDHPDMEPYGPLNYTFHNPVYKNYAGVSISAHDITTDGIFSTYPLSGFWVVWPPDKELDTVLGMLSELEVSAWIDAKTKEISLDFSIMIIDLDQPIIANVLYVLEVAPSGRFVSRTPRMSFSHYTEKVEVDGQNNNCGGQVDKEELFLEPAYFLIMPFIAYTVFLIMLEFYRNWRQRITSLYTYLELAYVMTASMTIASRWAAIYYAHCNHVDFNQTIWPTNDSYKVEFYEFKRVSDYWLLSRQAMSIAFFFVLVRFLQFITRLHTLDVLTTTIERAFRELAAFAFSFLLIFFAFVILFYFMFSADSEKYLSLSRCLITLWLAMLGDVEITESMHLNRSWAIPLLVLFTFTFVFVLLTVIIAIISDAHERVRQERVSIKEARVEQYRRGDIAQLSLIDQLKLRSALRSVSSVELDSVPESPVLPQSSLNATERKVQSVKQEVNLKQRSFSTTT